MTLCHRRLGSNFTATSSLQQNDGVRLRHREMFELAVGHSVLALHIPTSEHFSDRGVQFDRRRGLNE